MTASSVSDSFTISKVWVKRGGIAIALVLALLAVPLWLGFRAISQPDRSDPPSSIVVRQVRAVSELTTAIFEMDSVVPVSEKGAIAESKLLYIAHGNVRVGVDLSQFKAEDVQVKEDEISVTLPPLTIIDSKLDLEHSSVYSYDRGFLGWGPDVVNLQAQAQREALKKVEEAACQDWLIKAASERVENTVDHLLSQVLQEKGFKNIVVKTQQPANGSCSTT